MNTSSTSAAAMLDAQAQTISRQDRGPSLLAVQIAMIISTACAVALRFLSRRIGPGELWWDDWVALGALVPSLAGNITNILAISYGLGKHVWKASNDGTDFLKTVIPVELLFTLAIDLSKLSVLLLYKRIFSLDRKTSPWVNVVAVIITIYCLIMELVILLQCRPMASFWNPSIKGYCLNPRDLNLASAIGHILTTIMVIALPQPLIWKLNMSWRKKVLYSGICCLGVTTIIAPVGRIITVNKSPVRPGDFTWSTIPPLIYFSLEPALGIICACIPCLGPLFRKNPSRSPSSAENQRYRSSSADNDSDDASMLRRLGATCEVSIYTAARENMSSHFAKETQAIPRRRGGSQGLTTKTDIHVRNSTVIH